MAEPLTLAPPAVLLLVASVAALVLPRRAGHAVGVSAGALVAAWSLAVPSGTHLSVSLFGFDTVVFQADALSRFLGATLGYASAVAVLYADATDAPRGQVAVMVAYAGAGVGAVFAGDWLTLLVFWEVMAVGATLLLWHAGGDAVPAGYRYAVYHEIGSLLLTAGVLLQFVETGTFLYGGGVAAGLPALLSGLGIGLNAAFVGLHVWVPDAYPTPHVAASVLLAAVTTKVGVYALARAFPGGNVAVAWMGGAMLLIGVTLAVLQTDLRRLLSYHVVSQVGFMVAGVGLGTGLGLAGAMAHLQNNVLYKSLLFAVAGVVAVRTGDENVKKLGGLARPLPATFAAFVVAALAISGVPGSNGFVSKGMIVDAAAAADRDVLWWALLVGSVGTVLSFAKFGYYVFLHGDPPRDRAVRETNARGIAAMALLAIPCVVFGLFPSLQFAVLPGAPAAAAPFAFGQFQKAGAILAVGLVAFAVLRRPLGNIQFVPDLDSVYRPVGRVSQETTVETVAGVGAALDRGAVRVVDRVADRATTDRAVERSLHERVASSVLRLVLALVGFLVLLLFST
ncbi:Na(+)/H(+) antiporter subunit D [Halomicrococcus sp. NG-SE-24]|uniref:Na(+)/H(+) antiporter subunit D n=1 Tax=Halomicrococcus sp. NG-SE-24 TaxID=3436928 RepID=UPI003D971EB6